MISSERKFQSEALFSPEVCAWGYSLVSVSFILIFSEIIRSIPRALGTSTSCPSKLGLWEEQTGGEGFATEGSGRPLGTRGWGALQASDRPVPWQGSGDPEPPARRTVGSDPGERRGAGVVGRESVRASGA